MSAETTTEHPTLVLAIGDRVRMRLHPQWIGTVKSRNLSAVVTVKWDGGGLQMIDSSLLTLANDETT